ncbi:MAG: hypothetical protein JJ975_04405 [Bacteroidia bacterium]|nr:hypothetical protein [Bacteroidia bacterium]
MNKVLILLLGLGLPFLGFGQNAQFRNGFGINQDYHDYNVRLLDKKLTSFDSSLSQSVRLSYGRYLSRTWAFSLGLTNGFLLNQTEEDRLIRKSYIVGTDIDLIMNLNNGIFFKPEARIAPYLSFGYNFNYLTAYNRLGIDPLVISNEYGVGLNLRLGPKSKINVMAALDQQLNGDFDTHMQYRLGFAQAIGKEKIKKPAEPSKTLDYDQDGIADVDDHCPTLPGIQAKGGCPEDWAESGPGYMDQDSLLARLDEIDQELVQLETELERLRRSHIVEVKCIDEPTSEDEENTEVEPVVKTTEDETPIDKTADKDVSNESGEEADNQKVEKDEPKKTVTTKGGDPEQADKVKSDGSNQTDGSDPDSEPLEEVDGFDPMTVYKSKDEDKAYYVVAISTKDPKLAERAAALIAKDYPVVKILPQPNGYYRVGIYATKTKSEALRILDFAKTHGIPSGWVAYE